MRKGTWMVVFVLLWPVGVFAEDEREPSRTRATMEEVVVTGTRFEEKIERIPSNITVIDEEKIKNSNAMTIPDLLRNEEGIVVRDLLGTGKTAQVDLRGFGESAPYNVLVLVDGRRVNEIDLSGVDWTQIPIENIERIEIVRGTGSVLYGDNAVGGVINIITKIPSQELAFSAGTTFGSYSLNADRFSVSGGQGKVTGSLYGSYEATQGYRENNEYRAKDLGGKIILDATDALVFNLSGSYHSDDYGMPGPLPESILESDRRKSLDPTDEAETDDYYLKLGLDLDLESYGNFVADLSYRDRDIKSDFPDPLFPYVLASKLDTWAFTPRHVWRTDLSGHRNSLIVGADFYRSDQDLNTYSGFLSSVTTLTGVADISKDSYGFYFNDEFSVTDTLILSLGARYEKAEYDLHQIDLSAFPLAPLDETIKDSEPAYLAGLTWLYDGKSSLFARANRSFRFPLTDELVLFDYVAGKIRVNTELQPQTGDHYEVGIRHEFSPMFQANLTLFHADINDEIYYNRLTFTNENYDETLHQGVEVGGRADLFSHLTLFGNYTYEKATFEGGPFDGNEIPAVPQRKFNVGFRLHDIVPGLVFSAVYNYVGSSYLVSDQANQFEKLESYYTIDVKLSYTWKWINAFVGVNNLTDQQYSEYGVVGGFTSIPFFYPAPERNWLAGIEVTF